MNRRDFARSGTAAVVGSLAAGQLPAAASAFYGVDDTIRVGVVGCGSRGTGAVLQALRARGNVKLVAMADVFPDRMEQCHRNITDPQYSDWSGEGAVDAVSRIDVPMERRFIGFDAYRDVIPLVDVVLLTAPPGFRPDHFEACVAAGKHVFMEKPVATDAPGVRRVLAAAEQANRKKLNVVVGLQRHYETEYREWVQRLQDGAIGDVILSRVYWNQDGVGVREREPGWSELEYQMRNWYYFAWTCGDHIVEQHIHNIDVANWVKQAHPVRAQGQGGRLVRTGPNHGQIFDHHFVEFEYADGSRMLSQCRHMPGTAQRVTEAFHGTHGTAPRPGLILDPSGSPVYRHDRENDPNPYQVEHDELFAAVANGEYALSDGEMGAIATMTAIMGRMATYSGQEITWEEALRVETQLVPEELSWEIEPPVLPDASGAYPIPRPGVTRPV